VPLGNASDRSSGVAATTPYARLTVPRPESWGNRPRHDSFDPASKGGLVAEREALLRLRLGARDEQAQKVAAAALEWGRPSVAPVEPDEAGHPGWQVHAQVHAAFEALPAEPRTVVELAYFEGLTQSVVAARLGSRSAP